MTTIDHIYEDLHDLGIVRNQYNFSRDWMGQAASYYSSIKSRRGRLGTGALIALYLRLDDVLARLEAVGSHPDFDEKRNRLDAICDSVWVEIKDRYGDSGPPIIFDMRRLLPRQR